MARNTNNTKSIVKVSVPNVLLPNGNVRRVRFSARPKAVTARTTGMPKIKIAIAEKGFVASSKIGKRVHTFEARTPVKAFAMAAQTAWL